MYIGTIIIRSFLVKKKVGFAKKEKFKTKTH